MTIEIRIMCVGCQNTFSREPAPNDSEVYCCDNPLPVPTTHPFGMWLSNHEIYLPDMLKKGKVSSPEATEIFLCGSFLGVYYKDSKHFREANMKFIAYLAELTAIGSLEKVMETFDNE